MSETVTVHYRFHPLAGTQVQTLERRSHRGEPIVVVADAKGRRYQIPLWMTLPEAARWEVRKRLRPSVQAVKWFRQACGKSSTAVRETSSNHKIVIPSACQVSDAEDAQCHTAASIIVNAFSCGV